MKTKKWAYGLFLFLGIMILGGCTQGTEDKKEEIAVSESSYTVREKMSSANYSCKNKEGDSIFGMKMFCEIKQEEKLSEKQKLEIIVRVAEKWEKDMEGNIIEAEALWEDLSGNKKTYLLRGENLESIVNKENGKEVYKERNSID